MPSKLYVETFDDGPGGWEENQKSLDIRDSSAITRSPWWVDGNHAPPGGGYLHLLYILYTSREGAERREATAGKSRFIAGDYPTDWTNAKVTVRLKGELDTKGTQLVLLAQAKVGTHRQNHVLTAQPIDVTPEWTEQTITLTPDQAQWLSLGTRHDRTDYYGHGDIADVLRDLNTDIILVLHPVNVVPLQTIEGDIHVPFAGRDYDVDAKALPKGHVMLDEVRIEFP